MTCMDCGGGIDHCHGTCVTHIDGFTECTEGSCADLDPARHALSIDCDAVASGCHCLERPMATAMGR